MTPEQKAKELIEKYYPLTSGCHSNVHVSTTTAHKMKYRKAKECALIAVDEIMEMLLKYAEDTHIGTVKLPYWEEVKEHIIKM